MCSQGEYINLKDQIISGETIPEHRRGRKTWKFVLQSKTLISNFVNDFSKQVSHRTISVLNININIINKVLANRIQ